MRVESTSSRLDFDERRARALEGVVQYRPGAVAPLQPPSGGGRGQGGDEEASERRSRRRRRRGRRRPGGGGGVLLTGPMLRRWRRGRPPEPRPRSRSRSRCLTTAVGQTTSPATREARSRRPAVRADINGGAELHARYIAERLARHAQVEVITTCARDYITWRNELSPGVDQSTASRCAAFPSATNVNRSNSAGGHSRVFEQPHSVADEIAWLDSEGPASPAMIGDLDRIGRRVRLRDFLQLPVLPRVARCASDASKAVLVPTAERDPAIGLSIFGPVFRSVRAVMYNSPEERALITAATRNGDVPGVVVGVGSEVPSRTDPARFRRKFNISRPFAIYIGRIDENKGCAELFAYFQRYAATHRRGLDLVLVGNAVMPVPKNRRIHQLGFVSDEDKFDALAAADL